MKPASRMSGSEYWAKRGADHYHADQSPLFAKTRKGVVYSTVDNQMSRDVEDNLQEIGEAYLAGYAAEASSYQQRRA